MTKEPIEIRSISSPEEKSAICDRILRSLPDWFGIESSIVDYVAQVRALPFWAAFAGEEAAGFVALKPHTPYADELCVMGILPAFHRRGIGRMLVEACAGLAKASGKCYLTVKTLDGSRPDESYAKTRAFYGAMGFVPLEVFPTLWDEANPCLLMIRAL